MAEIVHFHRLAGLRGEIDPSSIDWDRRKAEHAFVWRASATDASESAQEILGRLKGKAAKLELVAQEGEREEVVQEDVVRVLEVYGDAESVSARLQWAPEENM
jgi:hypothetical protein